MWRGRGRCVEGRREMCGVTGEVCGGPGDMSEGAEGGV